jgi:hypothetical protein
MDIKQLDESDEITMRTMRRDGSWSTRPIWIVVVNDEPYVRSANGAGGMWYRKVLAGGRAEIMVDGQALPVSGVALHDKAVNDLVSDAYRAKYAASSPGSAKAMTTGEPPSTTLRLNVPGVESHR